MSLTNEMDDRNGAPTRARRGFAAMDSETRRELSSRGGRAAHARGHAHEFNTEEARAASRRSREARERAAQGGGER